MQAHADEPTDPPDNDETRGPALSALDASALLILLFEEPGASDVADVIAEGAVVSTVNLSEVAAVLVRHERDHESILRSVAAEVRIEPFTPEDALAAAELWPQTRAMGLSLGDRACLALAHQLGVPAVTADREWATTDLGITIRLVRAARN